MRGNRLLSTVMAIWMALAGAWLFEAKPARAGDAPSSDIAAANPARRSGASVVVQTLTNSAAVTTSEVPVRVSVRLAAGEQLLGLRALVDGRVATQVRGAALAAEPPPAGEDATVTHLLSIPIPARDCSVAIIAETGRGFSPPGLLKLRWRGLAPLNPGQVEALRPALYVLAVGVSSYSRPELRLRFAAKDALDFSTVMKAQQKTLYRSVEVKLLSDQQATKGNILDALEWLQQQTTAKDVAVLFFAGHGITESATGTYYFLPYDADPERTKRTMIPETDVRTTLASIPGKVLLFMDTCHSGKVFGDGGKRSTGDMTAMIGELASAENGVVVFAASTGRQASHEAAEWNNGAFTRALVEGLRGRADFQKTGRVTLNMLDLYISERVKQLTNGRQTPTTAKPSTVPDFPVAVVREINDEDVDLIR